MFIWSRDLAAFLTEQTRLESKDAASMHVKKT